MPIAVGESLYSLSQFKDYLQSGACSIVQVDVGRIGGITPWLKVAHMAEAYNVPVCPHFLMEIHVALCCAVPNSRWLEYIPQLDMVTATGMRVEAGRAIPSAEPGLGIDLGLGQAGAVSSPSRGTPLGHPLLPPAGAVTPESDHAAECAAPSR